MRSTQERPLSPTWLRLTCLSALAFVLTLSEWGIVVRRYPASGGGDGPFFFRLLEAGKVSFSRWHELPLWNPYECGGVPLWDNPQSLVAAPLVLLMQPFSTSFTMAAWVILHVMAGFVGMWLFARSELRCSRIAAFAAACLFAFSASHSNHAAGGHTAFVAFQYTPLALWFWRRGEEDSRFAIGLGLVVALMFYEGGVYAPAFIGLMLAAETVTRLSSPRRALRIGRAGLIVVGVAVSVAAMRLLPVADQVLHYKRPLGPESDFIDWQMLKDMYLDRAHALRTPPHEYVWGEYISYVGPVVLALAACGLAVTIASETWFFAVALVVFLLMLGHFSHWAPWSLLKGHVPPFISLRVPVRFRLLLVMFIAGWVAMAVDRVPKLVAKFAHGKVARTSRVVLIGLALFGAGDVAGHSIDVINSQWDAGPPQKVVPSTRLHLGGAGLAQFIDQPRQNRGRLECWEEWAPFAGAPLWTGDLPQARAADDKAAVYSVARTQNSFTIDADAKAPATLLLNTSYARGWRTSVGTVREQNRQLVVDVPEGHHRVHVWYWPVGLTLGIFLTVIGLAASIGALVVLRRRKRESAA